MATETFANSPTTVVTSGGTDAPVSGTSETWTVQSSSSFPIATAGETQFHVVDTVLPSEIILVTSTSGDTWTVTRGAESSAPVAHTADFTIFQVATAGWMNSIATANSGDNSVDWVNVVNAYGADPTGATDSTTAIQNAFNSGKPVYMPAGDYLVNTGGTSLQWVSGLVVRGDFAGTYPGEDTITGVTYLHRAASSNVDVIQVADTVNYGRIQDIAIDGNKNNNTSGYGMNILDGASGQETQIIIERCFFHDNPFSNLYLGHNRRANKVLYGVFNYSGTGDGITTAGSDNLIRSNIIGSNGRAGICLGTTITQNWAASASPNAAAVEHIADNDIYSNVVGIALASSTSDCMIMGNGIDRNTKQGITVYDGDSNVIECNSLHSNGTLTNNTYAHIDVASGVTQVGIHGNNFGPLDAGVTNVASYCVNYAGSTGGIIAGNIGIADSTASVGGLINSAANTPPYTAVAKSGAFVQGSGNDILNLRNSSGTLVTKVTQGGSFVHTGGAAQFSNAQNVMGSTTAITNTVLSVIGTGTAVANIATQLASGQTAPIFTAYGTATTTVLQQMDYTGAMPGLYLCTPSQYAPATQVILSTTAATMSAVSSASVNTGSFTAPASGSIVVSIPQITALISSDSFAFAFGLCAHGTTTPMIGNVSVYDMAISNHLQQPFPMTFLVTGLSAATSYNLDLMYAVASGGTLSTYAAAQTSTAPTMGASEAGTPIIMTVQAA